MPTYTDQWSTRSSALGYYMLCDQRAKFDRLIASGAMQPPAGYDERKKSSPYADFSTCTHWYMQAQMRCIFPDAADPVNVVNPPKDDTERDVRMADRKYTEEQFANAVNLFDRSEERTRRMMARVATLALAAMPTTEDGKPWLAESHWRNADCSGHIDFLSQDYLDIVDLKTTSQKPPHGRMKPEHLVQQVAYAIMVFHATGVMPKRIRVLYVSSKGEWVSLSEPFEPEKRIDFIRTVWQHAKYLRSDELLAKAYPRLGKHCFEGFCPYADSCRDVIIPPAAPIRGAPPEPNVQPTRMEDLFNGPK